MPGKGTYLGLLAAALVAVSLFLDAPATHSKFAAQGEGRFEQFTRKFEKSPDQARVLAAGYLGGVGTEWLVGGGFQPDGTVVVAGVSLGPKLELGNVTVGALGKDAPPPPAPERKQLIRAGSVSDGTPSGKPVADKAGLPKYEPFTWKHENATAFVVRLSPDLKQIRSARRFPWKSAGLTSAFVDEMGQIYLAGPATADLRSLPGGQKQVAVEKTGLEMGLCDLTYLACLSPDAGTVLWVRTFKGPSAVPTLESAGPGKVRFLGPDVRVFDAGGEQQSVIVVPGGTGPRTALNPKDGTYVRGGERPWRTGREPYRDPLLNVYKPDGTWLYELYNWDGPYVGLDNLRLVSDSAVRALRRDEEGHLVLYGWSDGGNSVFSREPNDVRRPSKIDGLGMSAWGAGVLSCAYILEIETKNYKVVAGTPWLAYLQTNKPNSIWLDSLELASDGSICFAGHSAWGLIQTGNKLTAADPAGTYVAVLSKDCKSLRFCSALPACGKTEVGDGARWGIVRGTVNGKPRVLFLGSASENEEVYGKVHAAPQVNPIQQRYGGGHSDGYLLLLDLEKNP